MGRLAILEEAHRQTLDALELAATMGITQGVKPLGTVVQILEETAGRLRKLLKFKALAFFLVREPGGELYLARCHPPGKARDMQEEMRILTESGSAAWALERKRPVFTSSGVSDGQLLLHSLTTASRIRGMFLGRLGQDIKTISDASLSLLTIVLRGGASLLEGLELYGLLRQANSELKAKVRDLEDSQRSLKREIEHRRKVEEQLKHMALHDPLTGLPNRTLMRDRIQQAIRRSQRHNSAAYAVAYMDLDKFKLVNDTMGHAVGDKLLVQVGERIVASVRQLDTVARFGGDEFVIFLEELAFPGEAVRVMKRVRQALAEPFEIDGNTLRITGSFGLVFGPVRLLNPDSLIKNADTAMHMAKEAGRNRIKVFTMKMRGLAKMTAGLATELRRAVNSGRTDVLFSPTLSTTDLRLCGFEAVPCWQTKDKRVLRGEELMDVAEKASLAWELWRRTLEKALVLLHGWRVENDAFTRLLVTLRLGRTQLPAAGLADAVCAALKAADLPGSALHLDIPEDTLAMGGETLIEQIADLKDCGVRLCVGDFGERFFSFQGGRGSILDSLSMQSPKSARRGGDALQPALDSLKFLAKALDLPAIGDEVRTDNTELLTTLTCLGLQRDSLSRPVSAEEVVQLVRQTQQCSAGALGEEKPSGSDPATD
ncbi:MAG: Diguanylate cyclase/phosphodiesterase with PAS/PAC [Desulfovibrionaceae bacterium]|nr:MAG: Diguanylate cyclase/phosphodiesterase with PAS/PAC [Desulfovibrionaceae bacterium]